MGGVVFSSSISVSLHDSTAFNPTALKKAKIVYNFGLSECSRVKSLIRVDLYHTIVFRSQISVNIHDFLTLDC